MLKTLTSYFVLVEQCIAVLLAFKACNSSRRVVVQVQVGGKQQDFAWFYLVLRSRVMLNGYVVS